MKKKVIVFVSFLMIFLLHASTVFGALSCSLTTASACSGTVLLRLSNATNAQVELPNLATPIYDNNVVCCSGISGLGNACSGNYNVFARLSGTTGTNAHVEKNSESNINYDTEKACISAGSSSIISVGYATDCASYDTTLFSMSNATTNAMAGAPSAYVNKVCAKIVTNINGGGNGGESWNPPPPPPIPTCAELGNCPIPPDDNIFIDNSPIDNATDTNVNPTDNPIENTDTNTETNTTSSETQIENIVNNIVSSPLSVNSTIQGFLNNNFTPVQIGEMNLGLKLASIVMLVIGGTVAIASILFLNPLGMPELILIPFRLWSLLLTALGLKKKIKPWGTVYDAVTKQPLDPVYVSLVNLEGEELASSITDIDGRYGFFVEPGVYKVIPKKTNYIFPSHALADNFRDEYYQDLYFGDYLNVAEGQIIVNNIPMDPINFDWNEFAKNKKQLLKFYSKKELALSRISNVLFSFGFIFAGVALAVSPEIYNIVIFNLYIIMFIFRRSRFKLRAKGRVLDTDGAPLSFAVVRVYSVATNVEILHRVVDKVGRYSILIPNGKYYVKIEKKNDDGTYSVVYKSEPIEIIHGVLNKVFNL